MRLEAARDETEAQAGQLDRIFEALTDGLMVYDPDGRVVRTNAAARRILGMDAAPPNAYARPLRERVPLYVVRDAHGATLAPEDWPAMRILRGEALTGLHAMDIYVRTPDGREVSLNVSGGPLHDRAGHLVGAVCVFRDQTERKQLEMSLRESERLFRTTFEQAAVGIAHVSSLGRFLRFNQRLCDIVGYERAELAALTFQDITHPDDLEANAAYFRRLHAGEMDTYEVDKRYICRDGAPVWVHLTASLVRTPEGEPDYVISTVQDITGRKRLEQERAHLYAAERDARRQAEAALARASASEAQAAERAEHLQTILETMADGVGVYDADGRLIQTNRAGRELLAVDRAPGFDALSFADQNRLFDVRDAATGEPLPLERIAPVRALRGEVVTGPDAEWRMRALDGRELEVNASVVPLRDHEGHVVGAVSVVRDVTWRKRLERERAAARADELAAREASRRMEAFLATAAHDLRTPLTAIVGYIALAQRQSERLALAARAQYPDLARQVEAVRDRVEEADHSAARLTRLLTLLFDTAAIRADRLELHRAPCDLAALVREQVAALRVAAPSRTIRLHAPAASRPIPVEADSDRIGQVVTNYLTNALKYAPPDRPIDISVEARMQGRAVRTRVAVCDAGPGIPKEERARVWELFHRAPGVAAQSGAAGGAQQGGLGLGLYICKAIIRAHGGRVGVKSAVGHGSTFWFTLPLARATPPTHCK